MSQLTPSPTDSIRPTDQTGSDLNDEMPDPDNLRIDRTDLITLPMSLSLTLPPSIGERITPARHRADFTRSA